MPHPLGLEQLSPSPRSRLVLDFQRCLDLCQLNVRQLRTRIALGMVLDEYVECLLVSIFTDKPTGTVIY
jgi:hypothetical protein